VAGVEDRPLLAVRAADPELELADRAIAREQLQLGGALRRVHQEVVHGEARELVPAREPEHPQERRVGVEDAALEVGDVHALAEVPDQLAERGGVLKAVTGQALRAGLPALRLRLGHC